MGYTFPREDQTPCQIAIHNVPHQKKSAGGRCRPAVLPQAYRDPLLLQVLGGFSCAEIGSMMELSEGAVMTRLTRARIALRKFAAGAAQRKIGER